MTKEAILLEKREEKTESGAYLSLQYLLLSEGRADGTTRYGIQILASTDSTKESASAADIGMNRGHVCALLALLAKGSVTPTTLYDVLQDIL